MKLNKLEQKAGSLILEILKKETQLSIDECYKKLDNEIPESIFHQALWKLIDDDKIELSQNAELSLKTLPPQ